MFGKRAIEPTSRRLHAAKPVPMPAVTPEAPITAEPVRRPENTSEPQRQRSEEYYDVKTTVFNALIDTIDLTQLAKLEAASAREEIRDIVSEIIQLKNVVRSI